MAYVVIASHLIKFLGLKLKSIEGVLVFFGVFAGHFG